MLRVSLSISTVSVGYLKIDAESVECNVDCVRRFVVVWF